VCVCVLRYLVEYFLIDRQELIATTATFESTFNGMLLRSRWPSNRGHIGPEWSCLVVQPHTTAYLPRKILSSQTLAERKIIFFRNSFKVACSQAAPFAFSRGVNLSSSKYQSYPCCCCCCRCCCCTSLTETCHKLEQIHISLGHYFMRTVESSVLSGSALRRGKEAGGVESAEQSRCAPLWFQGVQSTL